MWCMITLRLAKDHLVQAVSEQLLYRCRLTEQLEYHTADIPCNSFMLCMWCMFTLRSAED